MALVTGPRTGLIPTSLICGALAMSAMSTMSGCDEADPVSSNVVPVKIAGKNFHLELAADEKTRMRGMGGRTSIAEDGGMIFVFTPSQTQVQTFVMRDCPIDIDILYLDGAGRVLTTYTMKAEPRKSDGSEGKDGELGTGRDTPADRYEQRLKRYSSRFPSPFVIELAPGTIQKIGVKEGDQVVFDSAGLKRRAR
jgi:uncharacterized membrane protein (UPF0127 family)